MAQAPRSKSNDSEVSGKSVVKFSESKLINTKSASSTNQVKIKRSVLEYLTEEKLIVSTKYWVFLFIGYWSVFLFIDLALMFFALGGFVQHASLIIGLSVVHVCLVCITLVLEMILLIGFISICCAMDSLRVQCFGLSSIIIGVSIAALLACRVGISATAIDDVQLRWIGAWASLSAVLILIGELLMFFPWLYHRQLKNTNFMPKSRLSITALAAADVQYSETNVEKYPNLEKKVTTSHVDIYTLPKKH